MWYRLPPVGDRISLAGGRGRARDIEGLFEPYRLRLFHSGTAALAAAVMAAMARKPTTAPEVLLPAYACPDLVSAILHAGAKPVLVDLEHHTPWLDQTQLLEKINAQTVAIIGVNFLGIEERMAGLYAISRESGITLIEDSAQCLVEPADETCTRGDFIIQSFGRGKPASVLGGGAVLWRDPMLDAYLPEAASVNTSDPVGSVSASLKIMLYNALLTPYLYGVVDRLPFLRIGETRFKVLETIQAASVQVTSRLSTNIQRYRDRQGHAQQWLEDMIGRIHRVQIVDLAHLSAQSTRLRLLRYPLLVTDADLRERLYFALRQAGLGVSRMYPVPLPEISGLSARLGDPGLYPQAQSFAGGLLTLPTHQGVRRRHVAKMEAIILQVCATQGAH